MTFSEQNVSIFILKLLFVIIIHTIITKMNLKSTFYPFKIFLPEFSVVDYF